MGFFSVFKETFKVIDDGLGQLSEGLDKFSADLRQYNQKLQEENKKQEYKLKMRQEALNLYVGSSSEKIQSNIYKTSLNEEDREAFNKEMKSISLQLMPCLVEDYFSKYVDLGREGYIKELQNKNLVVDVQALRNAINEARSTYNSIYDNMSKAKRLSHNHKASNLSDRIVFFSSIFLFDNTHLSGDNLIGLKHKEKREKIIQSLVLDFKQNYSYLDLASYIRKLQDDGLICDEDNLKIELNRYL